MRRVWFVVAALIAATVVVPLRPTPAHAAPPTGGTQIVTETFTGSSVPDPAWAPSGTTCLTGASAAPPAGSAAIPTCAGKNQGPVPTLGATPGYLQFTDASVFKAGSILYQRPIPATAGISVTFEQYQYGGNEADGIGFFLVDGATAGSQVGGDGGSLGYAQRNGTPGVPGGYVGLGLDAYGNYYDDGEARGTNCPTGQRSPAGTVTGRVGPNIVTLRGPGNGLNGYCFLASTATGNLATPTSTLPGSLRGTPGPGNNLTPVKRLVNVQVTPAPNPQVIVQIDFTGTGTSWQTVLTTAAPAGLPSTYKFGFLASTGGNTDVHLIRNVVVRTINVLDQLNVVKQISRAGTPLPAVITAGTQIPYQYVVTNAGLETLTNLTVTDNKVAGIVCPATTLTPEPDPGGTVVCTGTYTVTAADVAAGTVVNTVTANATSVGGPVASPPDSVTLPLVSSLSVAKSVLTPPPYVVGQPINYQFTVTNTGGSRLSEVSVIDDRVGTGNVVCPANTLDPGASTTCTGTYTLALGGIAAGGTLTNTARATGVSPIGQPVVSPNTTATIPVVADVGVTKTVSDTAPGVGGTITFTVTATDHGPGVAGQVVVTDILPTGLTLLTSTPSSGTYAPASGRWTIPSIANGASETLTLTARVDTAAAITNGASITTTQVVDPNPDNNTASATLNSVVPTADIAITKRASQPVIRVGQTVTFVVTATNNGPFPATGVIVNDSLPSLLTLVSAVESKGVYSASNVEWDVGSLAVGQTAVFTAVARANGIGTVVNTAARIASSPQDINSLNDVDGAAVQIIAPLADLSVTKNVSTTTPSVGDVVTYTLTAFNDGPDNIDNVVVRELGTAPPGLDIVSVTVSAGTFDQTTLDWTIGTLVAGAPPQTLTAQIRVTTPGTKANTVVIEAPGYTEVNPDNNVASATLTAAALPLDIAMTMTATRAVVQRGTDEVFTVTATNNGPNAATGLTVRDGLPPGFTFVSSTRPAAYDPVTSIWTIGNLGVGASIDLQITATAVAVGDWINAATLSLVDQMDTDATNNSASVPVTVDEEADLEITKSVVPTTAEPGDIVTYTVTVTNHGPNDTTNVLVTDPSPIEADVLTADASQGTFDLPRRIWTIGAMASGQSVTLTATVLIQRVGTFTNTVQITQSSTLDPTLANGTARATLTVPAADLAVTKTASASQVEVGQEVVFTVQVTNSGPDTARAVQVADTLPGQLALVTAVTSIGTYDAATGVWDVGDLLPGASETLVVRALATTPGDAPNSATVTSSGPVDPDQTNNSVTVDFTVAAPPAPPTTPPVTPSTPVGPSQGPATLPKTGLSSQLIAGLIGGLLLFAAGVVALGVLGWDRRRRDPIGAGDADPDVDGDRLAG